MPQRVDCSLEEVVPEAARYLPGRGSRPRRTLTLETIKHRAPSKKGQRGQRGSALPLNYCESSVQHVKGLGNQQITTQM